MSSKLDQCFKGKCRLILGLYKPHRCIRVNLMSLDLRGPED